jgi:hypothetical protein
VNDESERISMTVSQIRLPRPSTAVLRAVPYAGVAAVTALALAACGPASGGTAAPPASSTSAATGGAGGGGSGQRQPGVNGLIAAVNGSTMQVQTRTDQTAVTWSDTTAFTKVATAALTDVTVGSCVTVLEPASSSTATGSSGAAPATQVTAASVDVRAATNGECAGGFGGAGAAGGPGGAPGAGATPPAGAPTGSATTGPGGRNPGDFGRRAVGGLVTAVSGDTITVQETMRARGNGTASSTATASPTSVTVSVTTTSSTTYTAQKAGVASDVAVGECATALGKADDTGAVTATSITLRPATNGTCTAGFGGGGGRGGATGTATTTTGGANG